MSSMRTLLHPQCEEFSLPTILYALGDPHRLSIVGQLAETSASITCSDIFEGKEVAKSTGSHHFKVLREAGIIRMVPHGRRVLVSLRRDDLENRFPGLLDSILATYRK